MEQADRVLQEMLAKRATMEREKDELVKYLAGEAGTKTETIFAVLSEFLTDFEVPSAPPSLYRSLPQRGRAEQQADQ